MTTTANPSLQLSALIALSIGASFEGGKFAGLITLPDGKHVAVVLLQNKSDRRLAWAAAMAWATEAGGQLPSRPIAALLFANLRGEFEKTWHWTNEAHEADASYAWYCSFDDGGQTYDFKDDYGTVRAVRLIHLEG